MEHATLTYTIRIPMFHHRFSFLNIDSAASRNLCFSLSSFSAHRRRRRRLAFKYGIFILYWSMKIIKYHSGTFSFPSHGSVTTSLFFL